MFKTPMKLLLVTALLVLAGCATTQVDPPNANVGGIGHMAASSPEVDVVFIHGMSYRDQVWAAATNVALAKALGRSFDRAQFMKNPGVPIGPDGAMLYSAVISGETGRVNTYAIVWSPITVAFKKTLCYDVSTRNPPVCDESNRERRAIGNGYLKSILLDGALSDVVYYLSEDAGEVHAIRDAVTQAVLIIFSGGDVNASNSTALAFHKMANRDAPLFVMSESLGSKILWDSVNDLAKKTTNTDDRHALLHELGNVEEVYMAANQIPLLSPADKSAPAVDWPGYAEKYYEGRQKLSGLRGFSVLVHEGRKQRRGGDPSPLRIVAFSDPNDVLSYKLRPYFAEQCRLDPPSCESNLLEVVDAGPHNATNWFGLVEDPWAAHTKYWDTQFVQRVLGCGLPPKNLCP
jgi:hypothetical protein